MNTTFKQLYDWEASKPFYKKLAKGLGGIRNYGRTKPIPLTKILDICGIDDCFWVLSRIELTDECARQLQLFACDCAERVLPIFEAEFPDDKRPRIAINTSRRYLAGEASEAELCAAEAARAVRAAEAAASAAWAAAWAASAAWAAASAAWAAAWAASAAWAAAWASWAAWAAWAAWVARAAGDSRTTQEKHLKEVLEQAGV